MITIKHLCGDDIVENSAELEISTNRYYDEYSAMHGDGSGWTTYQSKRFYIKKCSKCGNRHILDEEEVK